MPRYLWAAQPHFRQAMEARARRVIGLLAPGLDARALLVGVRAPDRQDGQAVAVEAGEAPLDADAFAGCPARVNEIVRADLGQHPSGASGSADLYEITRRKAVRAAVEELLARHASHGGVISFCGAPVRVAGYHVVPVLQWDRRRFEEHPRIGEPVRTEESLWPLGLLDAAALLLVDEAAGALREREQGRFLKTFRVDPFALLKDAAERFCEGLALSSGALTLQDVCGALNVIASLPYEGGKAIGEILFAPRHSPAVEIRVRLADPVPLYEHRLVRKLIEVSSRDLVCVCDSADGIGGLGAVTSPEAGNIVRVSFSGRHKWDLHHANGLLMQMAFGVPRLPEVRLTEAAFECSLRQVFPGIGPEAEARLWAIMQAAIEQKHGTIVVVAADAKEEARRLRKQSIWIEPAPLTPDLVRRLSSIDGALLVDPAGICHSIGVILDGMATDEGDPSRGARYNSALRYAATSRGETLCLVVSEDRHVDILPRPGAECRRAAAADDQRTALTPPRPGPAGT
jgi:hypothetical protein